MERLERMYHKGWSIFVEAPVTLTGFLDMRTGDTDFDILGTAVDVDRLVDASIEPTAEGVSAVRYSLIAPDGRIYYFYGRSALLAYIQANDL